MKAIDNEMSNLKCKDRIKQVIYVAKDFSYNNPILFNEILFY